LSEQGHEPVHGVVRPMSRFALMQPSDASSFFSQSQVESFVLHDEGGFVRVCAAANATGAARMRNATNSSFRIEK